MIADVPLGAFLSGRDRFFHGCGVDAGAKRTTGEDLFHRLHESGYDEAHCAKQVATHLGTDHTEFYVEPRHALDVIPHLADWFDEPFADPSQIPTYLVSELTRKHVTVALSGDGGDELFAGYNRYVWAERLARAVNLVRRPLRGASAATLRALAPQTWNRLFGFVPAAWRPALPGDKLHKITTLLDNPQPDAIYRRLVSQWDAPTRSPHPGASRADRCGIRPSRTIFPLSSRACSSST